ncbi:MAG: molybdopterin-dependent oxidoreductase [bacterium]
MNDRDRLPPGQRLSKTLIPLQMESPVPGLPENLWGLEVKGLVEQPLRWSLQSLRDTFHDVLEGDFHCVTGWSAFDLRMEGLSFEHLCRMVKPLAHARHVLFEAEGIYSTNLPLEYLMKEPAIICWRLNGQPIPTIHGGPLRLFVPGKYAYKAIKWLRAIRFLEREEKGYWEVRGYSNSADPWKEERYS